MTRRTRSRRLIELGARHIDVGQRPDEQHVVLADPEGNELCVIEPDNSFLADCGRLGSITCDGSPETGYFWSHALGWPLVWDQDGETAIRAPGRHRSVRHLGSAAFPRRTPRPGSISTSLRPTTVIRERRWTAWSPSGRLGSTSATAMSTGWCSPIPTAPSSACRAFGSGRRAGWVPTSTAPDRARAGPRRTRSCRGRGSAARRGSAGWPAPPPRRPAGRTPVRSRRRGSSGHPPPSPVPRW